MFNFNQKDFFHLYCFLSTQPGTYTFGCEALPGNRFRFDVTRGDHPGSGNFFNPSDFTAYYETWQVVEGFPVKVAWEAQPAIMD